jgi:hypothetical protein
VTRRILRIVVSVVAVALLATTTPHVGLAASERVDFSGKYLHRGQKDHSDLDPEVSLEVVQSEETVKVTRVDQGGTTTNWYPFDGSEGAYISPGGVTGQCKAQVKGKTLILDTIVLSTSQASGSPVHIHTKEQWQLSSDSRTLTIKLHMDFPDLPSSVSDTVGGSPGDRETFAKIE